MKISNLTEMATPSSMPDPNTAAPKFGRSDDVLESGVGTSTAGGVASVSKPLGKMRTRGQGSMFKGISTSSKYANSAKAGISEDSVNEDELSEEQLQAKKRREENFKKAKDRELGNKPVSREIMAKEAFNGEYDDEAGMADNNLETMRRAVDGIDDVIGEGDNLPEWCQEKIAIAKSMLVTVWDYMRSEEEIGEGYNNYDNNRTGFSKPKRDLSGEGEPEGMFTVMIDGRPWKEFTSNMAFARAKSVASKNPNKKVQVRWPTGQLNTVTEGVQRVDSLVTDALRIMKGSEVSDAVSALKTVLGDREYNSRRGHYNFYVKQIIDMYSQQGVTEEWSQKYKSSINCSHPKGFSQKAHCAGKKKQNEGIETEMTCPDCGMCETHGDHSKDNLDEACWKGYHKEGNKKMFGKTYPNCVKNTNEEQLDEKCWDTHKQVGMKNKGGKQVPNCVPKESVEEQHNHSESCPHCGGEMVSEELMNEKKDACYYKVKSRYKVWPSAYASGALVKCRKKGADSWGNGGQKSESMTEEELEESLHDWFNKEKWVRMDTEGKIKGPCAREPGEGKPQCLPQSKAHSLGKKGRASAAQRKRREDPNPERSGKAINVNTKKKS